MEKRFYVAKSCVYGLTVYDRESQCPAFEFGASCDMEDAAASVLAVMLNVRARRGRLVRKEVQP